MKSNPQISFRSCLYDRLKPIFAQVDVAFKNNKLNNSKKKKFNKIKRGDVLSFETHLF